MPHEHHRNGDSPSIDSGLAALVMLARFHNVAASPEQLAHEFANDNGKFSTIEILQAAKRLGLKASSVRSSLPRLPHTPLPAVAAANDGSFFLIAKVDDNKTLVHSPTAR
ncbi:MAG: cysteine peptidase family C39 domain-containing protein [Pseudomonadaceae bacterium]